MTPTARKSRRALQYVLVAIAGALLGTSLLLHVLAEQEDALLDDIVAKATRPEWSEQRKLVALTEVTHRLMKPRLNFFQGQGQSSFRMSWFRTVDMELVEARGSCGSFTHVLARLLDRAGIAYRIFQMYCDSTATWGCHILLEAKVDGAWKSVDASYNVVFPLPAREIGRNWARMKTLVPADYDPQYHYADLRYTNWEKVPVLMPAIRSAIRAVAPEFADTFSMRTYFLDAYRVAEILLLSLGLLIFALVMAIRRAQNVPGVDALAAGHQWLRERKDVISSRDSTDVHSKINNRSPR